MGWQLTGVRAEVHLRPSALTPDLRPPSAIYVLVPLTTGQPSAPLQASLPGPGYQSSESPPAQCSIFACSGAGPIVSAGGWQQGSGNGTEPAGRAAAASAASGGDASAPSTGAGSSSSSNMGPMQLPLGASALLEAAKDCFPTTVLPKDARSSDSSAGDTSDDEDEDEDEDDQVKKGQDEEGQPPRSRPRIDPESKLTGDADAGPGSIAEGGVGPWVFRSVEELLRGAATGAGEKEKEKESSGPGPVPPVALDEVVATDIKTHYGAPPATSGRAPPPPVGFALVRCDLQAPAHAGALASDAGAALSGSAGPSKPASAASRLFTALAGSGHGAEPPLGRFSLVAAHGRPGPSAVFLPSRSAPPGLEALQVRGVPGSDQQGSEQEREAAEAGAPPPPPATPPQSTPSSLEPDGGKSRPSFTAEVLSAAATSFRSDVPWHARLYSAGTARRGDWHSGGKLPEEQDLEIRRRFASGSFRKLRPAERVWDSAAGKHAAGSGKGAGAGRAVAGDAGVRSDTEGVARALIGAGRGVKVSLPRAVRCRQVVAGPNRDTFLLVGKAAVAKRTKKKKEEEEEGEEGKGGVEAGPGAFRDSAPTDGEGEGGGKHIRFAAGSKQ